MDAINKIRHLVGEWHDKIDNKRGIHECVEFLKNGIVFHRLCSSEILETIAYIASTSLFRNGNSITSEDHKCLVAWCAQILIVRGMMIAYRPDYLRLFEVCARLELYTHPANGMTDESNILSDSSIMVACMAFPMLEASLKNACSKYVGSDGNVCHDFSITNENGIEKKYGRGCRISSVMIYLFIYRQHIAGDEAIRAIDIICSNLVKLFPKEHPYKVIFDWRNSTMHGEEAVETAGLILMCLAYIIEISCFLDDYDKIRDDSIDFCINSNAIPGNRWLFYRFPI